MNRHALAISVTAASAIVFSALLGPVAGLTLCLVILLHELGHAAATWWLARRVPMVMVMPAFFGLTLAGGLKDRAIADRIAYQFGGAWMSSLLAVALLPFAPRVDWIYFFAWAILLVNFVNLLPVPGLDGGRISWLLTGSLPWGWRMGVTLALVAVGFVLAYWLDLALVWLAWSVNSVVLIPLTWHLRRKSDEPRLKPRLAVAWSVAHVVSVTAILHALWVMLSMGEPLARLQRGMGFQP